MMHRDYSAEVSLAASKNIKESKYWLKNLSGELVKSSFPCDFKKTNVNVQKNPFHHVTFEFPGQLYSRVIKIIKGSDVRLHMVLTAAVVTLLGKYTGLNDIIVGTPVYKQEIEGNFVNTVLILRNRLKNDITFKELILRVRETITAAVEHQNYPLETLLYKLGIPHSPGEEFPLFDVVILLENIHDKRYILHTHPDIIFSFTRSDKGLTGVLEYNSLLYKKSTTGRIVNHFLELIQNALSNLELPLTRVEFLPVEEKNQILVHFNHTEAHYPVQSTIPGIFETRVAKVPNRSAVVLDQQHITYRELKERSAQLAVLLREKGVGPDSIAAVLQERSINSIVDIMGILTAGGAYLPLELNWPKERILYTLRDCRPSMLLVDRGAIKEYSFTSLQNYQSTVIAPYVTTPRSPLQNLDKLPIPDRSMIDMEKYSPDISLAMVKGCISIQATRGCPYDCAYCAKLWHKKHVARSAEHIFKEVKLYYDMGVRRFSFIDDIFNLKVENSSRFFELVIDNGLDIQILFPAGLRGDIMTREYIDLMVKAGTINISVALETASPRLQKLINKNLDIEKLKKNLQYICETYPQVILDLFTMHGFPTETEEEALETLEFIKRLEWLHFPLINILKIYPNTDMEKLALENGITRESILESQDAAWHEFSGTLPFDKNFTSKYQADFLNDYFLLKERLLHVLPYQMKALTEDEMVKKYNSYLAENIRGLDQLLEFLGIRREELGSMGCVDEERFHVPGLNERIRKSFPGIKPGENAFRVLLLDLSQSFSSDSQQLDELVEAPLGLMYLMTWLKQRWGGKIHGKIAKSGIDFDNYSQLWTLLQEFKPALIGIRTLTFYREFFHQTVSIIKQWGFAVPIIVGGPYATNSYVTLLQDGNIDLVVLGEGEITFTEVIENIMKNSGKLPDDETLKTIAGIAFMPREKKARRQLNLEVLVPGIVEGGLPSTAIDVKDLVPLNRPGDMAYVIYTSGSTGKPKGTAIKHQSVINLVFGLKERIYRQYTPPRRVAVVAPYSFDASIKQIFAALLLGHTLHIVPEEVRLYGASLLDFYKRYRIEISDGTPTHLLLLLDGININNMVSSLQLNSLKHLIIGGEVLPKRLVEDFYDSYSCAMNTLKITDVYGPTECCVDAASFEVTRMNLGPLEVIPIGTPMPNVRIYIINREGTLLPVGAPGELCISGHGVGRGYLNNPVLTAEKFGHDLWDLWDYQDKKIKKRTKVPGKRIHMSYMSHMSYIYRTGDLARWWPDGTIEFLGRLDRQVKIRGYRIELEEIEAQLRRYPGIKDTAVVLRETDTGDKDICAYIVSSKEFNIPGLRKNLSAALPAYMIPLYFVIMESIPLTANGKVDKPALPKPEVGEGMSYSPPADRSEKELTRLWSEVLRLEEDKISRDADFFEIGGHSLKAVVLISKIHREMGVKIPIAEIFRIPTISGLAQYIKGAKQEIFAAIECTEEKEYYPLSSPQKRLYILQQMDTENIFYNLVHPFVLEGHLEKERFENTFKKLVKRHESLRTSFMMIHGELVQRVHDDVEFEIEYYQVEVGVKVKEEGEPPTHSSQAASALINSFIRPFDLSEAPLLRVALKQEKDDEYILMFDMHHIISDANSMALLVKEFMAVNGGQQLPPLKLQYKDYSKWQKVMHEAHKETFKRQEEYWLKQFSGEIPVLDLPTDYPRPVLRTFEGRTVHFELPANQARELNGLVSDSGTTLYMVLLAIFNLLLSKISAQEDIVVGTPVASRRHTDLDNIIGMFINTLPMRNYPENSKTFAHFLEEIKARTLEAFENQDYPLDDLVEHAALAINRDTSRNPLFDVMFGVQNVDIPQLEIPGLKLKSHDFETRTSRLDISLQVSEARKNLILSVEYRTKLFTQKTIERLIKYFKKIITSVTRETGQKISEIEIISGEEKQHILKDLNNTTIPYPRFKTLPELFRETAERNPNQAAVTSYFNVTAIYEHLKTGTIDHNLREQFENCCFKKNPYIFKFKGSAFLEAVNIFSEEENKELVVRRTHQLNYVAVNKPVLLLLDYFNGQRNIKSIFNGICQNNQNKDVEFLIYTIEKEGEENDFHPGRRERIVINGNFDKIVLLIKALQRCHLLELVDYKPGLMDLTLSLQKYDVDGAGLNIDQRVEGEDFWKVEKAQIIPGGAKSPVLFLGDRTGQASTGLLYMASFLRRKGIEAYCQWNDINATRNSLKNNVEKLLAKIQPKVVG